MSAYLGIFRRQISKFSKKNSLASKSMISPQCAVRLSSALLYSVIYMREEEEEAEEGKAFSRKS